MSNDVQWCEQNNNNNNNNNNIYLKFSIQITSIDYETILIYTIATQYNNNKHDYTIRSMRNTNGDVWHNSILQNATYINFKKKY